MKVAALLAAILFAAGAAAPLPARAAPEQEAAPAAGPRPFTLAEVSRAFTQVEDAERRGLLPEQRARWTAASAANPKDAGARVLAAYSLPHNEETWAELKYLAGKLNDSAIPWVAISRIYLEWGVLDQVDRALQVALMAERDDWLVLLTEAMLAERRGQGEEARTRYQEVLARDDGNVDARVGLARLAQAAGDEVTARLQCDAALAVLPAHAPALLVLAALAEARGDVPGTIGLLKRVVQASPSRPRRPRQAGQAAAAARSTPRERAISGRRRWLLKEDAETLVALGETARHDRRHGHRAALAGAAGDARPGQRGVAAHRRDPAPGQGRRPVPSGRCGRPSPATARTR